MVRQRGSALRLLSLVRPSPVASCFWSDRFRFFKKNRRWCGAIFLARSQRRSRWSMVGWSTGTRMVAVDVAIAHRGPKDVAGWSRVGGGGTSITARCRPARAVGLRDTLLPILDTVALATARPRGGTAAMTHTAGRMSRSPRPVRRVLGGITGRAVDGPRARKGAGGASGGCGVASWSRSARQSRKRCQSERKIKRRLGFT